jgi:uncharacterized damage-inducible protein DinB
MISKNELLQHWLGHRKLTRKVIEKFPEPELFELSIGGMRTFADLSKELLAVGGNALKQVITGESEPYSHDESLTTKDELLKRWDEDTEKIIKYFDQLSEDKRYEKVKLFGQYEQTIIGHIQYFIDNEIHHRGQGTVYLRALGIEPPFFWDRF